MIQFMGFMRAEQVFFSVRAQTILASARD